MYSNSLVLIANDINLIDSVLYANIIPCGSGQYTVGDPGSLFLIPSGLWLKLRLRSPSEEILDSPLFVQVCFHGNSHRNLKLSPY